MGFKLLGLTVGGVIEMGEFWVFENEFFGGCSSSISGFTARQFTDLRAFGSRLLGQVAYRPLPAGRNRQQNNPIPKLAAARPQTKSRPKPAINYMWRKRLSERRQAQRKQDCLVNG